MSHYALYLLFLLISSWACSDARSTLEAERIRVLVEDDFSWTLKAIYDIPNARVEVPDFLISFLVDVVGEFNTTNFNRDDGSGVISSYKLSDYSHLMYSAPYTESFPNSATLTGVRQTVRLPNGANFTVILAVSDAETYNDVDNWRVNVTRSGLKLSYEFSNWPQDFTNRFPRGVYVVANLTVRFIARESAQSFLILPIPEWPVGFLDYDLVYPYDVVNLSAPITRPPTVRQSVYNDRRAERINVNWFLRSETCDEVSDPLNPRCWFLDTAFFRLKGEDVAQLLYDVRGAFREEPIPFNFTTPFFFGLFTNQTGTRVEWDPSFDILFKPPPDPPALVPTPEAVLLQAISTGSIAAIVVVCAVVVIAAVTVVALREKIFPFLRKDSLTTPEIDENPDDDPSRPKSSWKAVSRPTSSP